jgi:hypothetical protein
VPPTATARPSPTPKPGPGDVLFSMPDDGCDWSPFGWTASGADYTDYILRPPRTSSTSRCPPPIPWFTPSAGAPLVAQRAG